MHLHVPLATLSTQTPGPGRMAPSLGRKVPLHSGWRHPSHLWDAAQPDPAMLHTAQSSACSPGLPFKLEECAQFVLLSMLRLGTNWGPWMAQQGAAADRDSWAGPIMLCVPTAKCHFFFRLCFSWCYFLASAQHLETTICAKGNVATPAACQQPPLRTGHGLSSSLCAQNTCRSEHSGNPRPPHVLFLNPARS